MNDPKLLSDAETINRRPASNWCKPQTSIWFLTHGERSGCRNLPNFLHEARTRPDYSCFTNFDPDGTSFPPFPSSNIYYTYLPQFPEYQHQFPVPCFVPPPVNIGRYNYKPSQGIRQTNTISQSVRESK
ncbi:hypothetical protein Bpfe_021492 [Biomphalaria pfeifferi]|uniref:Uncharacterized protein n=1 Tax=Biomphalaria pfeifferi TaxID=112525 RepID=A0AAD8B6Y0_BIOPF|nr:hypothetical protein Bpfe_021492 [Biomphalaria pfeifferi]